MLLASTQAGDALLMLFLLVSPFLALAIVDVERVVFRIRHGYWEKW